MPPFFMASATLVVVWTPSPLALYEEVDFSNVEEVSWLEFMDEPKLTGLDPLQIEKNLNKLTV